MLNAREVFEHAKRRPTRPADATLAHARCLSAHGLISCAAISKRVALAQHLKDGLDQNLDVEPKAPIVDVPEIHFYPPCDLFDGGGCAAQPINLRPSGHPGF